MNLADFKTALLNGDTDGLCREMLLRETNWFFDESGEIDACGGYAIFKNAVAAHVGVDPKNVLLVGSSIYGYSLSPNPEKTFNAFHSESDLDLVIVSEPLFRSIWSELLEAYHSGYSWIMNRHGNEVFRRFAKLVDNGDYKTQLLRRRVKMLDGISKQVFLETGSSRTLKYRIYESEAAAIEYHASGLAKIKRRIEHDP